MGYNSLLISKDYETTKNLVETESLILNSNGLPCQVRLESPDMKIKNCSRF